MKIQKSVYQILRCRVLLFALFLSIASPSAAAMERCFPKLHELFSSEIETEVYPGVIMIVDHGGDTIIKTAMGNQSPDDAKPMSLDSIFRIYSMTKPVTSVAVMMLVEEGKLKLEDHLMDYLPEFAEKRVQVSNRVKSSEAPITIRDLLRHTSGLTYGFFGEGSVREQYKAAEIGNSKRTLAEDVAAIAAIPLEHEPGIKWEYSRATDVLGRVIEVVSGMPLDSFFEERILGPLGMVDTSFNIPEEKRERAAGDSVGLPNFFERPANLSGGGGLVSTASDYLTFLRLLRNGGEVNGVRLLSEEAIRWMTSDQLFGNGIKPGKYYFVGWGHGFGLGFGVKIAEHEKAWPGPVGSYFWLGYGGTSFWIDPSNDLIGLVLLQGLHKNLPRYWLVRELFYTDYGQDGSKAASCLD